MTTGTQTSVSVYEETTYGVEPGTPAATRVYYTGYNVLASQALIQPNTITGSRQRGRPAADSVDVAGPIPMEVGAEDIAVMLRHLIGDVATTGADPYEHTITPAALPPGLIIELDNGPAYAGNYRYQQHRGCKLNAAQFNFPTTGYATVSFDVLGREQTYSAAPLDAAPLDPGHTSLPMAVGTIEENGVSFAFATDISLNITNDLETDVRAIVPGGLRAQAPEGFITVSGTLTALFSDTTLLQRVIAGTPSSLRVQLINGDGLGSLGNGYVELNVGRLIYEPTSAPVEGPGTRRLPLNFQGYLDGATDSITAVVRNQLASIVKP